jgi:hypothetical protein
MLMTDTGWNDFGCYSAGDAALGHETPNVDRMAKQGAVFTSWYGQASGTAGVPPLSPGGFPSAQRCQLLLLRATKNHRRKADEYGR